MSRPVNLSCPCDGDAYRTDNDYHRDFHFGECNYCLKYQGPRLYTLMNTYGKCLGSDGWAFMAIAAAEVAQERGDDAQR